MKWHQLTYSGHSNMANECSWTEILLLICPVVPRDLIGIIFGLHRTSERLPFLGKTVVKDGERCQPWWTVVIIGHCGNVCLKKFDDSTIQAYSNTFDRPFFTSRFTIITVCTNSGVQLPIVVSPCMPCKMENQRDMSCTDVQRLAKDWSPRVQIINKRNWNAPKRCWYETLKSAARHETSHEFVKPRCSE